MRLYELADQYDQIMLALEENGGELTDELLAALNENEDGLAVKADGYFGVIKNFEAQAEAYDAEIKRMTERKRVCKNAVERIKQHIMDTMNAVGMEKIEGKICKISFRNTTALDVDEQELLEQFSRELTEASAKLPKYITLQPKISKTAIKEVFGDHKELLPAGCRYVKNQSLSIR